MRGVINAIATTNELKNGGNGDWIACKDMLPKTSGKYLVTLKLGFVTFAEFINEKGNPHFNAPVIAWLPLPEEYKE